MGTVRGEELIAQSFKRENVDTVFFMMGGPTSGTAAACLDLGMQGIYVRHEQAAAMMAHAYAQGHGQARHLYHAVRSRYGQRRDRTGQRLGGLRSDYCHRRVRSHAGNHA